MPDEQPAKQQKPRPHAHLTVEELRRHEHITDEEWFAVVAVARDEPNAEAVSHHLANFRQLISSNLLEAEVSAVFAREGRELEPEPFDNIEWVLPTRSLNPEIAAIHFHQA